MTVKVVKPIKITEAVLTASSIPEPDASVGEVEWVERQYVFDISADNVFGACTDGAAYYIVDFAAFAVKKYNLDFVYTGFSIDVSGQTISPGGICFANGLLHVIDSGSGTVFKYNPDGSYTGSSFSTAQFGTFIDFDGEYFHVSIRDSYLIKVFDGAGVLSTEWDASSVTSGPIRGISIRGWDVYVSYIRGVIRRYSISGVFSGFELEVDEGDFQSPPGCVDLIVDSKINQILVQSQDYKVAVYELDGTKDNKYQPGERAILTSTHKLYQCVKATNVRPDIGSTGDENETWVEVSPTNRWSIFTDTINSASVITKDSAARQREFILKPQQKFTSCAVFGCSGLKQVFFQVFTSGDVLRQSVKVDMIDYDAALEWGLDDASPAFIDSAFIDGLNYFDGDYFKLIIDAQSGFEGSIKLFAFGIDRLIGEAINESMRKNYIDLSSYENDQFGNTRITKRPVVGLNTYSALVDGVRIEVVDRFLNSLAGEFNVWLADIGNGQKILTYGAYERAPTEINHNSYRVYTATIRSAI